MAANEFSYVSTLYALFSLSVAQIHPPQQTMMCTSHIVTTYNTTAVGYWKVTTTANNKLTNSELSLLMTPSMDIHQNVTSSKDTQSEKRSLGHVIRGFDVFVLIVNLSCLIETRNLKLEVKVTYKLWLLILY